jgi:hypothetical protein
VYVIQPLSKRLLTLFGFCLLRVERTICRRGSLVVTSVYCIYDRGMEYEFVFAGVVPCRWRPTGGYTSRRAHSDLSMT